MPENNTVIIAHRRRRKVYWEGYAERLETEKKEWIDYFRSTGQIVDVFSDMIEYRADCERQLDKLEASQKKRKRM